MSTSIPPAAERQLPSLPLVDSSRQAWSFALAGFLMETLLWGPLFSSGVYLKYYSATPPFSSSSETAISLIGTLSLLAGWLGLCCTSLLVASFIKSVEALIVLQGLLPGLAAALCAFPIIKWIPQWFDRRKGLAAGIIFSGGGVGGAFMPSLTQFLIDRIGLSWTLRAWAMSTAVIGGIAICFVKPRLPISASRDVARMPMPPFFDTFLRAGFFGCFFTTLLQGFGYFNVGLFLPRLSDTLSATSGAGLLAAFNVSCILAQIAWGHVTDRMRPASAMAISSLTGCILVLTLWGCGGDIGMAMFTPFAVTFGLATGGFSSMWSQSAYAVAGPDKERQTMLFSGFSIARGLGAAIGPTVGSALYSPHPKSHGLHWGSAGSPGFVALVAASLASSAAVGMLFDRGKQVWQAVISKEDDDEAEGHEMTFRPAVRVDL
ncbi:hypothetical protein IAR55_001359 [Kwoniella newhampshirensis]|uniref:Major facilitator superfamily (MFS) profile domain-containing protein n=1 Tax=Kwoniella newhampshirensis TaxID=1651941 RepID=A0AAW0Z1X9_9TREE